MFGGEDFAEFTDLGTAEIFAEDLERQAAIQSNAMHQQASQARMMFQAEKAAAEEEGKGKKKAKAKEAKGKKSGKKGDAGADEGGEKLLKIGPTEVV